ncbi:inositol-pentakisphosphate 2-kinase [Kipferlia bialata]|uniref:Inositol-pentakisphosphate 2-kinase n=1 Tax=Kipferlia bialata TaxID=797122 RepID=A0A9K3CS23_9EUKA|nr:inositol-pentakisphosphate 2-kinase [Kipferlia bialata]|eukprot:g2191.t1
MSSHLHTVADWEKPQIKTFTKWVNAQLVKTQMSIEDIATDFEDGIKLVKLCEVLFQKEVPMHSNPRLKFHKLENIDAALRLMAEAGVPQTGITNEMIISHNRKMILGMVWMLILRVQIEGITVEEMTAKEGLLLWCKRMTAAYAPSVEITNFTSSWRNGLAFLALLHKYNPTLVPDYQEVRAQVAEEVSSGVDNVEQSIARLNRAFKVAEEALEIPVLIDAEDVVTAPDDRSIMTYVSMWFHRAVLHSVSSCISSQAKLRDMEPELVLRVVSLLAAHPLSEDEGSDGEGMASDAVCTTLALATAHLADPARCAKADADRLGALVAPALCAALHAPSLLSLLRAVPSCHIPLAGEMFRLCQIKSMRLVVADCLAECCLTGSVSVSDGDTGHRDTDPREQARTAAPLVARLLCDVYRSVDARSTGTPANVSDTLERLVTKAPYIAWHVSSELADIAQHSAAKLRSCGVRVCCTGAGTVAQWLDHAPKGSSEAEKQRAQVVVRDLVAGASQRLVDSDLYVRGAACSALAQVVPTLPDHLFQPLLVQLAPRVTDKAVYVRKQALVGIASMLATSRYSLVPMNMYHLKTWLDKETDPAKRDTMMEVINAAVVFGSVLNHALQLLHSPKSNDILGALAYLEVAHKCKVEGYGQVIFALCGLLDSDLSLNLASADGADTLRARIRSVFLSLLLPQQPEGEGEGESEGGVDISGVLDMLERCAPEMLTAVDGALSISMQGKDPVLDPLQTAVCVNKALSSPAAPTRLCAMHLGVLVAEALDTQFSTIPLDLSTVRMLLQALFEPSSQYVLKCGPSVLQSLAGSTMLQGAIRVCMACASIERQALAQMSEARRAKEECTTATAFPEFVAPLSRLILHVGPCVIWCRLTDCAASLLLSFPEGQAALHHALIQMAQRILPSPSAGESGLTVGGVLRLSWLGGLTACGETDQLDKALRLLMKQTEASAGGGVSSDSLEAMVAGVSGHADTRAELQERRRSVLLDEPQRTGAVLCLKGCVALRQRWAASPKADRALRQAAPEFALLTTALGRLSCLSPDFMQQALPVLFSLAAQRSLPPSVRRSALVGVLGSGMRDPRAFAAEYAIDALFTPLTDPDPSLRYTALIVVANLILGQLIKPSGHLALAAHLVRHDPDRSIRNLAAYVFERVLKRSPNPVYVALPMGTELLGGRFYGDVERDEERERAGEQREDAAVEEKEEEEEEGEGEKESGESDEAGDAPVSPVTEDAVAATTTSGDSADKEEGEVDAEAEAEAEDMVEAEEEEEEERIPTLDRLVTTTLYMTELASRNLTKAREAEALFQRLITQAAGLAQRLHTVESMHNNASGSQVPDPSDPTHGGMCDRETGSLSDVDSDQEGSEGHEYHVSSDHEASEDEYTQSQAPAVQDAPPAAMLALQHSPLSLILTIPFSAFSSGGTCSVLCWREGSVGDDDADERVTIAGGGERERERETLEREREGLYKVYTGPVSDSRCTTSRTLALVSALMHDEGGLGAYVPSVCDGTLPYCEGAPSPSTPCLFYPFHPLSAVPFIEFKPKLSLSHPGPSLPLPLCRFHPNQTLKADKGKASHQGAYCPISLMEACAAASLSSPPPSALDAVHTQIHALVSDPSNNICVREGPRSVSSREGPLGTASPSPSPSSPSLDSKGIETILCQALIDTQILPKMYRWLRWREGGGERGGGWLGGAALIATQTQGDDASTSSDIPSWYPTVSELEGVQPLRCPDGTVSSDPTCPLTRHDILRYWVSRTIMDSSILVYYDPLTHTPLGIHLVDMDVKPHTKLYKWVKQDRALRQVVERHMECMREGEGEMKVSCGTWSADIHGEVKKE